MQLDNTHDSPSSICILLDWGEESGNVSVPAAK